MTGLPNKVKITPTCRSSLQGLVVLGHLSCVPAKSESKPHSCWLAGLTGERPPAVLGHCTREHLHGPGLRQWRPHSTTDGIGGLMAESEWDGLVFQPD